MICFRFNTAWWWWWCGWWWLLRCFCWWRWWQEWWWHIGLKVVEETLLLGNDLSTTFAQFADDDWIDCKWLWSKWPGCEWLHSFCHLKVTKIPNMATHWHPKKYSPDRTIFATLMIHISIIVERFGQTGTYNLWEFDTFRFREPQILKILQQVELKFVKWSVMMAYLVDEKRSIPGT